MAKSGQSPVVGSAKLTLRPELSGFDRTKTSAGFQMLASSNGLEVWKDERNLQD